jgi:hypothetical protein
MFAAAPATVCLSLWSKVQDASHGGVPIVAAGVTSLDVVHANTCVAQVRPALLSASVQPLADLLIC